MLGIIEVYLPKFKLTVSLVVAGNYDDSPHSVDEVLLLFRQLLSQLCEAFEA